MAERSFYVVSTEPRVTIERDEHVFCIGLDRPEAHRIGLVQEVLPSREDAIASAKQIAHTIARQAPLAVRASLRNARIARDEGTAAALADLMPAARRLMTTQDAMEGMMSFIERRDAKFRGE